MRKYIIIVGIIISLLSCITTKPKDFTYQYKKEYTGLDTLIDINGYYISQRECDPNFRSIFKFYPDGLFIIATGTDLTEIIKCFENDKDKNNIVCKYPSWGVYEIVNDTIKTQTLRQEGIGFCTIFRDYKILGDKTITNISDYAIYENSNVGYMPKYPSFRKNHCPKGSTFYPLQNDLNTEKCPFLSKKWFYKK